MSAAVLALGRIKDPRAIEPLRKALSDRTSPIQWNAVAALREIGGREAAEALLDALCVSDSYQTSSHETLIAIGRDAMGPLVGVLRPDEDPRRRAAAAGTLGEMRDKQVLEPLAAVLRDSDKQVRTSALEAPAKIRHKQTVIILKL